MTALETKSAAALAFVGLHVQITFARKATPSFG
jgi:hypothetical protein